MFCIITIVTSLTQGTQIIGIAMLWRVVKMSYCKNNTCQTTSSLVVAKGMVSHTTELTPVSSTF